MLRQQIIWWIAYMAAFALLFPRIDNAGHIGGLLAGAAFGMGKGGLLVSFVLLFLHLFPVVPGLEQRLKQSEIARPLVSAAGMVVRAGWRQPRAERDRRA